MLFDGLENLVPKSSLMSLSVQRCGVKWKVLESDTIIGIFKT